jgi:hypothetical protein
MSDIIKYKDFFESRSQEDLSDDIETIEFDDIEKVKSDYEIESIIDVSFEEPEEKDYGNELKEGAGIGLHADLSVKEVKRGQILWISALLRKKGTTSFNSQAVQGVIKVRVVDYFYGLQYMKKALG